MISKKIIYTGNFDSEKAGLVYNIARKVEMTGEIKLKSNSMIELILEGDPSMIKLIQHQVERKIKDSITSKIVESHPLENLSALSFKI
jgi:acylphosphatase